MRKAIMRQVKLILVVFLGYLLQVTLVMRYVRIGGVVPNLLLAVTAIVTVGYGKLRGLWVGCVYGIVMEVMQTSTPMLNLMFYPVTSLLGGVLFADKSASRLQYERSVGKAGRNTSPYLRTLLCTATGAVVYEIVNVAYKYLRGTSLDMSQVATSLAAVFATALVTAIIMYPVRKLLGFRKPEPENPVELRFGHRPERD